MAVTVPLSDYAGVALDTGWSNGVEAQLDAARLGYIPEIWAGKFQEKFYKTTVFGEIANTEYEGQIKAFGDTVHIRKVGDVTIAAYTRGLGTQTGLTYSTPTPAKVDLDINKAFYYAIKTNNIEEKQADLNYMNAWADDAAQQMKIKIDEEILDYLGAHTTAAYDNIANANEGATAGVISSSIDLGTAAAGFVTTKANIIDKIVEMGQVLDEQNCPESDRWLVLPAWMCARIKTSDLKDASLTGDSSTILRNGKIGMVDRFTIYMSNQVDVPNTGIYACPFGHKSALTFATQMVENSVIDDPADFGKIMRGLQVYGRQIVHSEFVGIFSAAAS